MRARRYTVLLADRSSGVIRRATFNLPLTIALTLGLFALPMLIGLGAKWSARAEIEQLQAANSVLKVENGSYRAATGELTTQIQSLEGVINELGTRATLAPEQLRAMQKLPAIVKSRAMGGGDSGSGPAPRGKSGDPLVAPSADALKPNPTIAEIANAPLGSPEDTFGILRDLLQGLERRLLFVRRDVERREKLASATPSMWPTQGWLTGTFGMRSDPFSGEQGFHQGIDISADKGTPVLAPADGTVESSSFTHDYGNLLVVKHGFGLMTRYGHLSGFAVKPGQRVKRGDVIGYVGSTGRSTGSHLHYEILANGQLLNPLQLLSQPPPSH